MLAYISLEAFTLAGIIIIIIIIIILFTLSKLESGVSS